MASPSQGWEGRLSDLLSVSASHLLSVQPPLPKAWRIEMLPCGTSQESRVGPLAQRGEEPVCSGLQRALSGDEAHLSSWPRHSENCPGLWRVAEG